MLQRSHLNNAELNALVAKATLIESDSYGPKVYRLDNGEYLKLFRRKRLLSSALLVPYSVRFCRNAAQLQSLDIPTIEPLALYQLADSAWTAVHYRALAGHTLKDLSKQVEHSSFDFLPELIAFFHTLHDKGIYFRSLHLGNVVMTPENELGLIDIADMKTLRRPLRKNLCLRNFQHMRRYKNDHAWLLQKGGDLFFESYIEHSAHQWKRQMLSERLALPQQA